MNEGTSAFGRFLAELSRRHVGRVAIAYAAVSFVILQLAEIVLPAFEQPEWVLRLLVVFALLGFPVALALAWIYDVTPHGIERTEAEGGTTGAEVGVFPRLAFLAITVAIAAGSGWWFVRTTLTEAHLEGGVARGGTGAEVRPVAYEPDSPITSLAVLPLADFSEDEGQAYFAAGMHEALIAALSQLDGVRVISRTTVAQYDATAKSMPRIGRDLQVEGVVEGSVLRAGERVRITVQLIHAPSDTHVWTRSYEEELSDIISLQGRVAADIAAELKDELHLDAGVSSPILATVVPEARDLFMKGRFEQTEGTPEALRAAAQHFEAATRADPSFAEAYAALSSTLLLLVEAERQGEVDMERVEQAAARALELDADLPEAIAVFAAMDPPPTGGGVPQVPRVDSVQTTGPAGTVSDADFSMRQKVAVRLEAPEISDQAREAWVGAFTGPGGEAALLPIIKRAMEMGRLPIQRRVDMAQVLVASGHAQHAIPILETAVAERPESAPAWSALERAHTAAGDFSGAVEVRKERMARLEGRSDEDLASLDEAFRRAGPQGYWEWSRSDMESRLREGEQVGPADLATVYAALGSEDQAYEWLRRAVGVHDPGLVALRADPVWDPYRDDPEFRELARRARGRPPTAPEPPGSR